MSLRLCDSVYSDCELVHNALIRSRYKQGLKCLRRRLTISKQTNLTHKAALCGAKRSTRGIIVFLCFIPYDVTGAVLHRT